MIHSFSDHLPIFNYVTPPKNSRGDMVVMSIAKYEEQQALLELYKKLGEAEKESEMNASKTSHEDLMNEMRTKLDE